MSGPAGAADDQPPRSGPSSPDDHDHPHDHDHHHHDGNRHDGNHVVDGNHGGDGSAETLPPPTGPGTVLVDIGGTVGAAVVTTPGTLAGEEIEIRPEPGEWTGRHVAVRPRPLPGRTIHAAFFESLDEGPYVVRVRFGPVGAVEVPFEVTGGRVTQVAWPD